METTSERATVGRRALAEYVGTFFLAAVGTGIERTDALLPGPPDRLPAALGPGLVVAATIYALGAVSGAHLNPLVTIVFATRRAFPLRWVPAYLAAQLAGALSAAVLVWAMFGRGHGTASGGPSLHSLDGLAMEAALTCFLLLVILNTAHEHTLVGTQAALAVGATIVACRLVGALAAGATMNPATWWCSAIVLERSADAWWHLGGQAAGAGVAFAVMAALHPKTNVGECEAAEGEATEGGTDR